MGNESTLSVYVDGSVDAPRRAMAFAYVAYSNLRYISQNYKCVDGVNPAHAETLAIGLAAKDLLENESLRLDQNTVITFNVDCASALTFVQSKINETGRCSSNPMIVDAMEYIRKLNTVAVVEFEKVTAHKFVHSANKYVDALAKYACRSGECMQ